MTALCRFAAGEESPSTTGQGRRVTPGGGDSKESATEIYRELPIDRERKGGKAR